MDAESSNTKTKGRSPGRSETAKAAALPARPLVDRAAPNASPRTKKIAAQSRAQALGKEELKAVVLEMGTAMGWNGNGRRGSKDTKDWGRVRDIINTADGDQGAPERARQIASWRGKYGVPLHWAAWSQAPLDVVAALLKAFPEGAKEKNDYGWLPLHYAAEKKGPNWEVVATLLKAFPEGAKKKNMYCALPLHDAIGSKAPLEVVAALLKAFPEGAKEKDKNGDLTLHIAIENQAPLEVVAALLKAFPEGPEERARTASSLCIMRPRSRPPIGRS